MATKPPKGLTITRNHNDFTCAWQNGQKYSDVDIKYYINGGKAKSHKPKKADYNKAYAVISAPGVTSQFAFTVRGAAKKKESKYPTAKTYNVGFPATPIINAEWDSSYENRTTFTWSITNTDPSDPSWYLNFRYRANYQYKGENMYYGPWADGAYLQSEGVYNTPEPDISRAPFLRQIQVYSVGKRGPSSTVTAQHVYSTPEPATNLRVENAAYSPNGYLNLRVTWTENVSFWHPIDKTELHYAVAPPASGMKAPLNLQGNTVTILAPTWNTQPFTNGSFIELDKQLVDNECLFFRVKHIHDTKERYSEWKRVTEINSKLANPSYPIPTIQSGNIYTVEATNNASEVPDSFLAITYKTITNDIESETRIIGIIPNGESEVDVYIPRDSESSDVDIEAFGVQAIAYPLTDYYVVQVSSSEIFSMLIDDLYTKNGDTYVKVPSGAIYDSSKTYYAKFRMNVGTVGTYKFKEYFLEDIDALKGMESEALWSKTDVPKPPSNFSVVTKTANTALASWNWSWNGASFIEISWAQNSDAWESTNEPTVYRVRKNRATSWTICDLQSGEIYYFRARFIKEIGEGEIEGPWSVMETLNLTSAPLVPTLSLAKNKLTIDQDLVASWVYVSSDGTIQDGAEIFLVTVDNNGTRRGTYKKATEILDIHNPDFVFNDELVYYTYESGSYIQVVSPVETDLNSYYMFDDTSPLITIPKGSTQQQISVPLVELDLERGKTYYLSLRLLSKSGVRSEWSPFAELTIVEPLEPPTIPSISAFIPETVTETVYEDDTPIGEVDRTFFALKSLPITFDIRGAGETGTTMITIERAEDLFTYKPDNENATGYTGEIIALIRQTGEAPITITRDDLLGSLDDRSKYILTATIIDENGQTASTSYITADVTASDYDRIKSILFTRTSEIPYEYILVDQESSFDPNETYYYKNEFTVSWAHQPTQFNSENGPKATFEIDTEHLATKITTTIPENFEEGDVVDIYRLSADKPQLIVSDGIFGQTYVDPYPAFGEFGGHRIVYKTKNGDYITEDNEFSWADLTFEHGNTVESEYSVINFENGSVEILYNINLSSNWKKDFQETKYLGGHIQGDWNPGVSRTVSINTVSVITKDQPTILAMRRLADYSGIVNIRTRDGSSYAANIDVSESLAYNSYELINYTLNITRVDAQALDGMTLEAWNRLIEGE